MAYHFRKLRNTLRLLPSTKSFGITRANEGDGVTICSEATATNADSKQLSGTDCSSTDQASGLSRSQSDSDLVSHLLPAIPCNTLPATVNDLTQILRLPIHLSPQHVTHKDFSNDVSSILRIILPTSDDILSDPWGRPDQDTFPECTGATYFVDRQMESIPVEVLRDSHTKRNAVESPPFSFLTSTSMVDHALINSSAVQTFSSDPQSSAYNHHLVNTSICQFSRTSLDAKGSSGSSDAGKDGPTPEQMQQIKERLEKTVSKLFSGRQDYSILHKNVVLENNLFGHNKTCVGMLAYGAEMLKLQLRVHARFSNVSIELQSVTMMENPSVIRIHWRLKGLSQIQTLKFWRIFQKGSPISKDDYEWLEAFSYFHIGKDGLVHKHRIDRSIPDDASGKDKIAEKLKEFLVPAKPLVS